MSEQYDEVVFTDPTESFFQELLEVVNLPPITLKDERAQAAVLSYSDEQTFLQLLEAKRFLFDELNQVKKHFLLVERETNEIDTSIKELQHQLKANRKKPPLKTAETGSASKKQKS